LKIKKILRIVFTQGGGRGPTTTPGSRIRTTTTLPPSEEKQNLPLILIFGFEKTNICSPLFSSVFLIKEIMKNLPGVLIFHFEKTKIQL